MDPLFIGVSAHVQQAEELRNQAPALVEAASRLIRGAALPEAWAVHTENVEDARIGAREMLHNHRVLRVAIVEDRIPLQFVEWVGR
jgi:hypothetical protein